MPRTALLCGFLVVVAAQQAMGQYVNRPPKVDLRITPRSGSAPLEVVGDVSRSSDSDGNISRASVSWDFDGDGSTDHATTGVNDKPRYTYYEAGYYTAVVQLTDEHGSTSTETLEIRVSGPGQQVRTKAPGKNESFDGVFGIGIGRISFDGGGSDLAVPGEIGWTWKQSSTNYWHGVGGYLTYVPISSEVQAFIYGATYTGSFRVGSFSTWFSPFFSGGPLWFTSTYDDGNVSGTETHFGWRVGGGLRFFPGLWNTDVGFEFSVYDDIIDVNSVRTNNIELGIRIVVIQ